MAKYLVQASYSQSGTQGLLKDGGTSRREVVEKLLNGMGGKLESFYYAFGESDLYAIVDVPDSVSMVAASLVINAAGAVALRTTALITPEEIDQAVQKSVAYTPPGS